MKKVLQDKPLAGFSIYTQVQVEVLIATGKQIQSLSEKSQSEIPFEKFQQVYGLFWLWVLGAYEVVRTMDQHKKHFCVKKWSEISTMKKRLAVVRVPFAKQEIRGNRGSVTGELSASEVNCGLHFSIEGQVISANELIYETVQFFLSFSPEDVRSQQQT